MRGAIGLAILSAILAVAAVPCRADECSDVHPGALHTPSPNWDSNPYPDACYVDWKADGAAQRAVLEAKCRSTPGFVFFKPDHGSGRNTCIFSPSNNSSDRNGSPDNKSNNGPSAAPSRSACGPDQKLCEGHCIPDNASCCRNGHGTYCPTHGTCCFNPANPRARNNYVCCPIGQQCIYEEGPLHGVCVSPDEPRKLTPIPDRQSEPNPQPQPQPQQKPRRELHASSFQYSCQAIAFVVAKGRPALRANCRRINQTLMTSTLVLRGISNQNGQLVQGQGNSSFQYSCADAAVTVDNRVVYLSASCKRVDGSINATWIELRGIENIDGRLMYTR